MKVLSVVGARPQFVKPAPIAWQLARRGDEHLIVHTGQHYDHLLSQSFFDELAGTLAAAARDLPVAHLEAGLRSFDRTMPEERWPIWPPRARPLARCWSAI